MGSILETDRIESQLRSIFSTVLDIPVEQVVSALSPQSCPQWDSLNQIHLVNAIEEEFGFSMSLEDQMRMLSFEVAVQIASQSGQRR